MASAKRRQRAVQPSYRPDRKPAGHAGRGRVTIGVLVVAGLTVFAFTAAGTALMAATFRFLEFYSGVFSLVALSLTVMGGLAATDRLVLMVRHRILLQSVHRSMATAALAFLGVHIVTKVAEAHASVIDVIVPFVAAHRVVYIGLGTIAGWLMVAVAVTGIVRGRFAGTRRPWMWRTTHALAYACWPVALLHGLNAGRAAKGWVVVSYVLCLILVGLALAIRVGVIWTARVSSPRTRTRGVLRPRTPAGDGATGGWSISPASPPDSPATPQPARQPVPAPAPSGATAGPDAGDGGLVSAGIGDFRTPASPPADPRPGRSPAAAKPVGRWANTESATITDEEFWAYLRSELRQ